MLERFREIYDHCISFLFPLGYWELGAFFYEHIGRNLKYVFWTCMR